MTELQRVSCAVVWCGVTILCGQDKPATTVGIRGSMFTLNGHATYTPEAGFPDANTNLTGTLLNVRAVEAIFDDANYPGQGSREHPYQSNTMGTVSFEYPGGTWDPDRTTSEFIGALP